MVLRFTFYVSLPEVIRVKPNSAAFGKCVKFTLVLLLQITLTFLLFSFIRISVVHCSLYEGSIDENDANDDLKN